MSMKIQVLKEFAEYHFDALEETLKGLDEAEMSYKPTEVSNSIDMILNHVCRISNTTLPRIARAGGDPNYEPVDWPKDYKDHRYRIERYITDLSAGKKLVLESIGKITDAQLNEQVQTWGGTNSRKVKLFDFIGEIIHHRGQIAYIRGTVSRLKSKGDFPSS
jgi:uncharacterized damage-inducible protein DinB